MKPALSDGVSDASVVSHGALLPERMNAKHVAEIRARLDLLERQLIELQPVLHKPPFVAPRRLNWDDMVASIRSVTTRLPHTLIVGSLRFDCEQTITTLRILQAEWHGMHAGSRFITDPVAILAGSEHAIREAESIVDRYNTREWFISFLKLDARSSKQSTERSSASPDVA